MKRLNDAKLQEVTNKTSKLRSMEASTKNGASVWLTVIPTKRNGFFLEKHAYCDQYESDIMSLWNVYQRGDSLMKTKRNGIITSESFKSNMDCKRFFSLTAERLANRIEECKSKHRCMEIARLNFALIRSMLLCLQGTRTHSNVNNISEIDLCMIVAKSNIE